MKRRREEKRRIGNWRNLGKSNIERRALTHSNTLGEKALQAQGIHCVEEQAGTIMLNTDDSRINK
jgi:hypothetical protein